MNRYQARGASTGKEDVHAAIRGSDPGLYPTAFCKLVPDVLTGDPAWCAAMHADGTGTKAAVAYLTWRETGNARVFRGLAQDALVMNLDDLLCVGALGPFLLSNTIGRHSGRVPGEVLAELIAGYDEQAQRFGQWGIEVLPTGGETADLGDLVGTLVVDATLTTRLRRTDVIANDRVRPGDLIYGIASFGQTTYEAQYNSGMGSNGLTSARHDLLHRDYAERYPETCDSQGQAHLRYVGPFHLQDALPGTPLTVGQALLSPTRTYAPIIKALLAGHRGQVSALVHCTGGGQTKCLRVGKGLRYVKDNLFALPPLFALIQQTSGTAWREMHQVFNMGHRFEVIGPPTLQAPLEAICRDFRIEMRVVGHCEAASDPARNEVTLRTPGGVEEYAL